MMIKVLKKLSRVRIGIWLISIGYVLSSVGSVYAADTPTQNDIYNEGIYYYDVNGSDCSTTSGGTVDTSNGADTAKWQTTLQAPYSLEDFVVEVLRDIAVKENVPETTTVTAQHVLALVAFAYGEGGNLTNHDIYNPWNTGYSASDLEPATGHSVSGVQSYSSFNDGVEASARVMTGTGGSSGYQSRLGQSLATASTSATDFMKTLTYYQKYKGNKAWATASMPPNQTSYYQQRLNLINTAESHYKSIASSVIGPPGDSYSNNQHTSAALRYSFSGDTSSTSNSSDTSTTDDSCTDSDNSAGAVQGNIVKTAINLAWDDYPTHDKTSKVPKASYLSAKNSIEGAGDNVPDSMALTDCGVFVATVMRSSGADPNWPLVGSGTMLSYAKKHPDKYTVIPTFSSTADLQVGDILATDGHIYIYVGKQADGKSVAEASHFDHVPVIDNDPYPSLDNGAEVFSIIRMKQ